MFALYCNFLVLFAPSLLPLAPFFSLFLLHITQAPYLFFPFFLVPCPVAYLSLIRLPASLLHTYKIWTLIPTADMTKIKQNITSGLNYFKRNCPIFRFAIQTLLIHFFELSRFFCYMGSREGFRNFIAQ